MDCEPFASKLSQSRAKDLGALPKLERIRERLRTP